MTFVPRREFLKATAISTIATFAIAQDADDKTTTQERVERLAAMTLLAATIFFWSPESDRPWQLSAEPLFRFNDPTRDFHDGTIWAYGGKGRPVLLVTLEKYEAHWAWELTSLATDGKSVAFERDWTWKPKRPGLVLSQVPEADDPAESATARLSQMKALARRMAGEEIVGDQRFELRLLAQPVRRFDDAAQGIVDGAIFLFVYGTNPEVAATIECHRVEGKRRWLAGFVPLTTAAATMNLDGKAVWTKTPDMLPQSQDPYTYFTEPAS